MNDLLCQMKNEQNCQIWTLARDKAEYERFSYLLEKPDELGLDEQTVNALLREDASQALSAQAGVTLCTTRAIFESPIRISWSRWINTLPGWPHSQRLSKF
ncbi:MAG: hypothetical protein IPK21_15485 [Haliscomenobacter sp.]|nr:hypothetical protein [Haliscomenobacter sp.]